MTNTKHTQGTWISYKNQAGNFEVLAPCKNGGHYIIADVGNVDLSGNGKANSRLIAAAPELLEALKLVMGKNSTNFKLKAPYYLIDICEAAIAKAEGN